LGTDRSALIGSDLVPFSAAIEAQVSGIMLSHIRYRAIDPRWPASLSTLIAHDLLRTKMGYDGLVLTDDIDMGAIAKHYSGPDIVRQCLDASVDILLICHESPKIDAFFNHILAHQEKMAPSTEKMDAALNRILRVKQKLMPS
jgi:beta-N-acetylhexosaminidase